MALILRVASESEKTEAREFVMSVYHEHGYLENIPEFRKKAIAFSDTTITIIAEEDGEITGSLSVILDNHSRLPIDALCPSETKALRTQGRRICELSQFAVTKGSMNTSLLLCKYAKIIACDILHLTDFVISSNPKHEAFYLRVLKFSPYADEINHPDLSQTNASILRLNLLTFEEAYREASLKSRFLNLHEFFFGSDVMGIRNRLTEEINCSLIRDNKNRYHEKTTA